MTDQTAESPPPETNADSPARVPAWQFHRRMYDWVLHWADTPHGAIALFLLAFAESSFFPIPPDVLLIALVLGAPRRWWWLATICSLGSVCGGVAGYLIGWGFWEGLDELFYHYVPGVTPEAFAKMGERYDKYGITIVFVSAFTPIPYKLFTISAGVFKIDFLNFVLASAVGRAARFFLVSMLLAWIGPKVRPIVDKYFNILTLAFVVLLVGGFVVAKVLLK